MLTFGKGALAGFAHKQTPYIAILQVSFVESFLISTLALIFVKVSMAKAKHKLCACFAALVFSTGFLSSYVQLLTSGQASHHQRLEGPYNEQRIQPKKVLTLLVWMRLHCCRGTIILQSSKVRPSPLGWYSTVFAACFAVVHLIKPPIISWSCDFGLPHLCLFRSCANA